VSDILKGEGNIIYYEHFIIYTKICWLHS